MKLLYSSFDPQTGKSIVALTDKNNNTYIGQARLHPDDKNNASNLFGCRLAEKRAWIKYFKEEYKKKKIELNTIKQLNNDIKYNYRVYTPKKIQRRINIKLRDYSNEINEIKNNIEILEKELIQEIKTRDKILYKIKKDS